MISSSKASPKIVVSCKFDWEYDSSGRVQIKGVTNLPDSTKLLIHLKHQLASYSAQDVVAVSNGQFASGWFNYHGSPVPIGKYYLRIITETTGSQSSAVNALLGKDGENLAGPLVVYPSYLRDNIKIVEIKKTIMID